MTSASSSSNALIDGVDVDAVAAAVTACPGVSGLFGGRGDAIASYLPGRRVPGVEVSPRSDGAPVVVVHVRCGWNVTAAQLLDEISTAVDPLLSGARLEIVVDDIDDTTDDDDASTATRATSAPMATQPAAITPAAQLEPVPPVLTPDTAGSAPAFPRSPGSSPSSATPSPLPTPPNFPTA